MIFTNYLLIPWQNMRLVVLVGNMWVVVRLSMTSTLQSCTRLGMTMQRCRGSIHSQTCPQVVMMGVRICRMIKEFKIFRGYLKHWWASQQNLKPITKIFIRWVWLGECHTRYLIIHSKENLVICTLTLFVLLQALGSCSALCVGHLVRLGRKLLSTLCWASI